MWVLIVVAHMSGWSVTHPVAASMLTQEFNTKEACEVAQRWVLGNRALPFNGTVTAQCFEKG